MGAINKSANDSVCLAENGAITKYSPSAQTIAAGRDQKPLQCEAPITFRTSSLNT